MPEWFDRLDRRIAGWMNVHGRVLLRIALGINFFWFGALKLFDGASPAQGLIADTVTWFDPAVFIPVLGIWEMLIGALLILGRYLRLAILLLFLQMPGTMLPLLVEPAACFSRYPFDHPLELFVLTLEGQYIVKNLVLISAALVVGGTVRYRTEGAALDPAGHPAS